MSRDDPGAPAALDSDGSTTAVDMVRKVRTTADGSDDVWTVEGPTCVGDDSVMLFSDDDLTADTPWSESGFHVEPILSPSEWHTLRDGVTELVARDLQSIGVEPGEDFALDRYHRVVQTDDAHRSFTRVRNAYFPIADLPLGAAVIEDRLSKVLGTRVITLSPSDVPASFGVRIVRPRSGDNNPPHCDAWLPRLRSSVTVYLPLAGSSPTSSLTLVPGSHRWAGSDVERTEGGGIVNGVQFSVPAVAGSSRPLHMVRPDPAPGEALIFSPYLIHGGARNRQHDLTRVSLELRFERAGGENGSRQGPDRSRPVR